MIHFKMIWRSWMSKPASPAIIIVLLAISISLSVVVSNADARVESYWKKQSSGVDLVVGAKGSPLQLVLANIFHADAPTGNLEPGDFERLSKHPKVKKAIPLAYGDYFEGYRILGSNQDWFDLMNTEIAEGDYPKKTYQCVAGAEVAKIKGFTIGSTFTGSHGEVGGHHHHHEYKVVGILKPKGDITDRLLITPIKTVWAEHHTPKNKRAATAILLQVKTAMAKLTLPRELNKEGEWMVAVPAIEISKLLSLTGDVSLITKLLAAVFSAIAALMLFLLLLDRAESKRKELALFRFEGAPSAFALATLFWEGILILLIALISAYPITIWCTNRLASYHSMLSGMENPDVRLWLIALLIGGTSVVLSSLLPWLRVLRINLSETLRNELD